MRALLLLLAGCGYVSDAEVDARAALLDTAQHDADTDTDIDTDTDTDTGGGPVWVQVSADRDVTCAVDSLDRIACWGSAAHATPPTDPARFVDVSARFACALSPTDQVFCWGLTDYAPPTALQSSQWAHLAVGSEHACVSRLGVPTCWSPTQTVSHDGNDLHPDAMSAGDGFTCGITATGHTHCWGAGRPQANVGDGPAPEATLLAAGEGSACAYHEGQTTCVGNLQNRPPSGSVLQDLAVGNVHACAIDSDRKVLCWGDPDQNRLAAPVAESFVDVTVGVRHSCAIRVDGALRCWGANDKGQAPVGPVWPDP